MFKYSTDNPVYAPTDTKKIEASPENGISLLKSLLDSVISRSAPRRAVLSNIPLELAKDWRISVSAYMLFKRQEPSRSTYIWLEGETPKFAIGTTSQVADDTSRTVEKGELRKAYKFGGEQISFTTEEQQDLRKFGEPGIRIVGFRPLADLPFWANVKQATFIYPTEQGYVGSTRVFSALWQRMRRKREMALTWFIPRKNAGPTVAVMIAGEEELDENGRQKLPAGLWIVSLPTADDVRPVPELTENARSTGPLVDKVNEIVSQLLLPKGEYDPSKYPNPCEFPFPLPNLEICTHFSTALQWHYRVLQTVALDEELTAKPEDKTIPRFKQIDKVSPPSFLAYLLT